MDQRNLFFFDPRRKKREKACHESETLSFLEKEKRNKRKSPVVNQRTLSSLEKKNVTREKARSIFDMSSCWHAWP